MYVAARPPAPRVHSASAPASTSTRQWPKSQRPPTHRQFPQLAGCGRCSELPAEDGARLLGCEHGPRYSLCLLRLAYLHEGLELKIVHHYIKSSNILLDRQWNAKVSDFGPAKLLCSIRSSTTRVMGTFGYVAPEYAKTGMLNKRSGIFTGVLVMEVITGRTPMDYTGPTDEVINHKPYDHRADIFNFAVILKELVTSKVFATRCNFLSRDKE